LGNGLGRHSARAAGGERSGERGLLEARVVWGWRGARERRTLPFLGSSEGATKIIIGVGVTARKARTAESEVTWWWWCIGASYRDLAETRSSKVSWSAQGKVEHKGVAG